MLTHLRDQRKWLKASLLMGVALALLNSTLNRCMASPVSQLVFHDSHGAHGCEQQSIMNTAATTILDILGERSEFSKLLELIQKDKDLTKVLGDPSTKPTLFAPTNEAFDSVSDIDYPTRDVLMYHITALPYNYSTLHDEFVISTLFDSAGLDNSPQRLRISLSEPDIPSTSVQGIRNSLWREEPEIWMSEMSHDTSTDLYVNRAKVIVPDLIAKSGGIVHGVDRIIRPPGETILDEVMRRGMRFTYLSKAWTETGVDAHIRDGKSMTLFAAPDKAWSALPKKLMKWLFSDRGREHLKIFSMYQIANKVVYTPDILKKTEKHGKSTYPRLDLHTLLNSPAFELHVQGKARKSTEEDSSRFIDCQPLGLTDLIETFKFRKLFGLGDPTTPPGEPDHHYPHKDPDHPHHHPHRDGKHHGHGRHRHHRKRPHNGDGGGKKPKHPGSTTPRRDEIIINGKAKVLQGLENWIAGNGVIHVVDKVLMPPRSKGCEKMTALECSAWETIWDLGNVGFESVVDDAFAWFDDMTLFDNIEGVFENIENPFQPLWSTNEDLAEMAFEEEDACEEY
ncbi:hypothetical protein BG015_001854 [Linnemannia schmuckeri]|uniref:FAS1 domain-containing protein n=1 Tax=Linnemannia schmuckeri TaxID=64567 RepID=A0A9P5S3C8_9FUNG|nr:hypothetical protein BG015_001854 [Linnemannia schmuckeri]